MDSDNENAQRQDDAADTTADDPKIGPGALLAGSVTGANMGSGMIGSLGGGAVGGVAAAEAANTEDDEEELPAMNYDALGAIGNNRRQTGDDGVSPTQREAESDELNG